jgi:hypothetical protein
MRALLLPLLSCGVLSCAEGSPPTQAEPANVYLPLRWSDVEAVLLDPQGARPLAREQLDPVLATGVCLEGPDARGRLERALKARGWSVTQAEPIGEVRLDLTAEQPGLVLAGSLTLAPAPGCAQGFVYSVRKVEVPR